MEAKTLVSKLRLERRAAEVGTQGVQREVEALDWVRAIILVVNLVGVDGGDKEVC